MASPSLGPTSSFSFLAPSTPPQPHKYPSHYFRQHGFHLPPLLTLCIVMVTVLAVSGLYYAISRILTRYLAAQAEMVEPLPAEPPVAEVELEHVPVAPVATQAPPAVDDVEAPPPVQVVPPPELAMPPSQPLSLPIAVGG